MKRVAVPCENGSVSAHFGHAPEFAFFDVDPNAREIRDKTTGTPPAHEPGALPAWLVEQHVHVVLAGGMGGRARSLLEQVGVEVVVGVSAGAPRAAVEDYLRGGLQAGDNACDHGSSGCH